MSKKQTQPTRRGFLKLAAAAVPASTGLARLGFRPHRIVELVPQAATGTMRLVERVVWRLP